MDLCVLCVFAVCFLCVLSVFSRCVLSLCSLCVLGVYERTCGRACVRAPGVIVRVHAPTAVAADAGGDGRVAHPAGLCARQTSQIEQGKRLRVSLFYINVIMSIGTRGRAWGVPMYTFHLRSDAGHAGLPLTLLGAPVDIGA